MTRTFTYLIDRIRFIFQAFLIIYITASTSLRVVIAVFAKRDNAFLHLLVRRWARRLLKICGIRLIVHGKDNIQPEEAYIFVSNHTSLFDIPVLVSSFDHDIRFMYKRELQKIPIFGWGMEKMPYIPVTRSDPRNAMESIENAVNQMKEGASVIVFPEGTRSKTGRLGEFKRGAFMLATRAGKPIVPVAISGTSLIMPAGKFYFSAREVHVEVFPPIRNSGEITRSKEREIMDNVRQTLAETLEKE